MASLARTLTGVDLVFITVGTVIGSGIFLVPATVLQQSGGSLGIALGVWVVAGILSVLGAFTYGELGAMKPDAGGIYTYVRDAFGPLPAFLYGWTLFFLISAGSVATLSVAFSGYLREFVELTPLAAKAVAVAMIVVVAAINVRGTRTSASVQNWTTATKAAAIVVMSVLLLAQGGHLGEALATPWPARLDVSLVSGAGLAMIAVLWAYEGWQYATFSAGETVDPQRVFPRALFIGTAGIMAIYVLANLAYVASLGTAGAAASSRVAADATTATLGPWAGKAIAAAILVSMFSAANALTLTAPRAYYAMARDGVFFARLAVVHPRFGTPAFAVVAGSAWAAVLAATGTFEQLLTYVVFAGWVFYALGAASVFYYRHAWPAAHRPFRVPGYPVTPLLFVASAAAIVVNTIFTQPGRAAVGLALIAAGTPAYWIWAKTATGRFEVRGEALEVEPEL